MKTITNINVYGLDPQVWDSFRALLAERKIPVSKWAIDTIHEYVAAKGIDIPDNR